MVEAIIKDSLSNIRNILGEYLYEEIKSQFRQEAIDYGCEVFFPTFSLLSGMGRLAGCNDGLLKQLEVNLLDQNWQQAIFLRAEALQLGLKRILEFSAMQQSKVCSITFLDGDPHNGGKRPIAFDLTRNGEVQHYAYKPVPATSQIIFQRVSEKICKYLGISEISTKLIHDGGDYYVRSFVVVNGQLSSRGLENYYYSFGVLISIAMLLEMTDLHFENIVVSGDSPVIIDAEFILPPADKKRSKWSLVTSGLFFKEISPLNQISNYSKIKGNIQETPSNHRYRFGSHESYNLHLVKDMAGKTVVPSIYSRLIEKGVRDGLLSIRIHSEEIQSIFGKILDDRFISRCLLRNTSLYKIMQMRLWTPSPVRFNERVDYIRKVLLRGKSLHTSVLSAGDLSNLVETEISSLKCGDIPYFWTDNSLCLLNTNLIISKNFGSDSARNRLSKRLRKICAQNPSSFTLGNRLWEN